jgi:phospholipid/cholesterol/gamma-HCH transport system substrate-binding protein
MEKKINYAMVGLFVIVLGATWLAISLWLALGDFSTQYTTYHVYMDESVSGLYLEAPVKYRGVEIGKVKQIKLNPTVPDQVQLTLDVDPEVRIKEDTIAVLSVQGMTGIAFVDLTGGSLGSPLLEAKDDLAEVLDAEGTQALRETLVNINKITSAFANRQAEMEQGIVSASEFLENGAVASGQFSSLLSQLDATAKSFEDMAATLSKTGENVNRYVANSGAGVQQFSRQTLPELGALISELRRLADTLQGIGQNLEDDPRVLIYGRDLEVPGPGE